MKTTRDLEVRSSLLKGGPNGGLAQGDSTAQGTNSFAQGTGNQAQYPSQAVFGKYNQNKEGTLLEVGNGTGGENRSNALEVLSDGRVKAYGTPLEAQDLTPKGYVDELVGENVGGLVSVTYSALVALRNSYGLVPGRSYRITNFCTTVNNSLTWAKSANKPFDLIVTANSNRSLSEVAKAVPHSNDTYFTYCDLSTWELRYCLDNDTNRFAWADNTSGNGKGVIYWMKDEFGNEAPYDFKNILFKRYKCLNYVHFGFTTEFSGTAYNNTPFIRDSFADANDLKAWTYTIDENTSVTYYTENEAPAPGPVTVYDSNGQRVAGVFVSYCFGYTWSDEVSAQVGTVSGCYAGTEEGVIDPLVYLWTFTFGYLDGATSSILDATVAPWSSTQYFSNNKIAHKFGASSRYELNDNVFISKNGMTTISNNTIGHNSYKNTLYGLNINNNTIGDNCSYNLIGSNSSDNIFKGDCDNNSLGKTCLANTFEDSSKDNSLGVQCSYNIFGIRTHSNSLGRNSSNNAFNNSCFNFSIGNTFEYNYFGGNCQGLSFTEGNYHNTFGGRVISSYFKGCENNNIGAGCSFLSLTSVTNSEVGENCTYLVSSSDPDLKSNNTFGQGCSNIFFRIMNNCLFENACKYIEIEDNTTPSKSLNYARFLTGTTGLNSGSKLTPLVLRDYETFETVAKDNGNPVNLRKYRGVDLVEHYQVWDYTQSEWVTPTTGVVTYDNVLTRS